MRDIQLEINKIIASIAQPEQTFKIVPAYGEEIKFQATASVNSTSDSVIKSLVINNTGVILNLYQKKVELSTSSYCYDNIKDRVCSLINDFLIEKQQTKNNKLTALYRWYRKFLTPRYLRSAEDSFENDMFAVFKYILSCPTLIPGQQPTIGIIAALEALKSKYENKGMTL